MEENKLVHEIKIRQMFCGLMLPMKKGESYIVEVEHEGPKQTPIEKLHTQGRLIASEIASSINERMEGVAYKVTEYKITFESCTQQWNVEIDLMSEKSSDELNKNNNQ